MIFLIVVCVIGAISIATNPKKDAGTTAVTGSSSSSSSEAAKQTQSQATPAKLPGMNQAVQVGEVALLVASAQNAGKSITYSSFGNKLEAAGTWVAVKIRIANTSNKTKSLGTWDFELTDSQGRTYEASSQSFTYAIFQSLKSPSDPIPPGSAIETTLLFDVTANATGLKLVAKPDFKKQEFELS